MRPSATFRRATMVAMVTSIGIALATAILAWLVMRPPPLAPIQSSRFAIVTPPAQPLNVYSRDRDLALSPDGRHLVYRAGGSETAGSPLMVRAIGQIDARLLADITWAGTVLLSRQSMDRLLRERRAQESVDRRRTGDHALPRCWRSARRELG